MSSAAGRGVVRSVVNDVLGSAFAGKVIVGEIDQLDLHGVSIRDAVAFDPRGAQVARIDGTHAEAGVLAMVRALVRGYGNATLSLARVHVDQVDLLLEQGSAGELTIAETFRARRLLPPPSPGEKRVRVRFERLEIGHGWIHGRVSQTATLDAEVTDAAGVVSVGPDEVQIDALPTRVIARAPGPQPTRGLASFHMEHKDDYERMSSTFEGSVGPVNLSASAARDGDKLQARLEVPATAPQLIASLWPGHPVLPLRVPVSVSFDADGQLPEVAARMRIQLSNGGFVAVEGQVLAVPAVRARAAFEVHDLDLTDFVDVAVSTPFSAVGNVRVERATYPQATFEGSTQPLQIGGVEIPAVDGSAVYDGHQNPGYGHDSRSRAAHTRQLLALTR